MTTKKNILPPPMTPQEKPITVAVLTEKLGYLFNNVKELVDSTARRTETVLRKEMHDVEQRLDAKIDGVEKRLTNVESDVKEIKTTVNRLEEKFDNHETRLTAVEGKVESHISNHP